MGLTHVELGSNATAGVSEALTEGIPKLTRHPDRGVLRAMDRCETGAAKTGPSERRNNGRRFGNSRVIDPRSEVQQVYSYTGTQGDVETAVYYYRHRTYHSQLGRFASRDPAGYVDGHSVYLYVSLNPVAQNDPLGLNGTSAANCCGKEYDCETHGCCRTADEDGHSRGGTIYARERECCEERKVVSKVPIWICKRPLDSPGAIIAIIDMCQLNWLPPWSYEAAHSYVCCNGPNINCFGKQSTCKAGDDIPVEKLAVGECEKVMVCPRIKKLKCNSPKSETDYSILDEEACHGWAWKYIRK